MLRVGLGWVNTEANDPHIEVINQIITTGESPTRDDCSQCYHPKLYLLTCAGLIKFLQVTEDESIEIKVCNMVSVFCGVITLAFCFLFLALQSQVPTLMKCIIFSLIALNPRLIAINAQATNDSMMIMLGTMVIFFVYLNFRFRQAWAFIAGTLFLCLAMVTKASGLAVFVSMIAVILV